LDEFDARQVADYTPGDSVSEADTLDFLEKARCFLNTVEKRLKK